MSATVIICHEPLATGYFLALASTTAPAAESHLAAHLAEACRSGKPAVWVDCRLLQKLSASAAWLLWACQQRLRRRHARLVLCQVPEPVRSMLRHTLPGAGVDLPIVATLDEAVALTTRA